MRRSKVVRPGDPRVGTSADQGDVECGSYGLDQCLALVEDALERGGGAPTPAGHWVTGRGMALSTIHTIPPRGRFSDARVALDADGRFRLTEGRDARHRRADASACT